MVSADQVVRVWNNEGVATLEIDHPPVNSLSAEVVNQLTGVLQKMEGDPQVRAVIITGSGEKAFVAGANIKEFPDWIGKGEEVAEEKSKWLQHPFDLLDQLSKPTIAAINGLALGGGCELALACDLRIAEEHAQIGLPEITLGLFPGAGGTQRLPRLVGEGKAKELMFTGEPVSAREALRIGLVNIVVPQGKALKKAQELAEKISRYSLPALSLMKKAITEGRNESLERGLAVEAKYFGKVFQTEDVKEGVSAFIEKRRPTFTHQ
ncbi:enoyl-CoA hydratase [Bacillus sp. VT-16-64]|uniref:enoyl-CoA hydratase n=1 Tax=Siminovitchia thermophila TaxID=1245522 RepID=UPI00097DB20D|nr:enoyl-CoA hydratase [Siminovitchia thermophila]ONK23063.1 enoyl-CoA hydratase [Bacillus sp. VT-16-64]